MLSPRGHPHYYTLMASPEVERSPCSKSALLLLTVVAAGSLVALAAPTQLVTGATSLFSHTSSSTATKALQSSTFVFGKVRSTHDIVHPSLPERRSGVDLAAEPTPSPSAHSTHQMAGIALASVAATVLSLFNRLRLKKESSSTMYASSSAVLDPPMTSQPDASVNNKGIVSADEGTNLPFTMGELRDAIPKECFEKSLGWSLFYFARDWAIVGLMYHFQPTFFGLGVLGKLLWWNIVGFYGWCLFVVGHDCGHGSFSNYGWLNQLLGHVCHAPLLVPFNAWRISHRHHHQYHNDIDRDHSWRPSTADNVGKLSGPIKQLRFSPLILLVYPFYLMSPSQENGFSGCHFWPWNPLFTKEERLGVGISALSTVAWLGFIMACTAKYGFMTVFQLYWVPYMIFVAWLDLVTLMQHTDKNALFFRGKAWNYLRGAMSTIDRTYRHLIDPFNLGYGRVIDHLHHHISDGHVVHHIFFTQIPHYRLMLATEAIKPILGKHYRYDDTPILQAFMTTLRDCWFVDDVEEGVVTYRGKDAYATWEAQKTAGAA